MHNSVFAAHRLQCRMTNRKKRHPAFCFFCGLRSAQLSTPVRCLRSSYNVIYSEEAILARWN